MGEQSNDETSVRRHIDNCARLGVCPNCGKEVLGDGYGTGSIKDGYFCSMNCLSEFWYTPDGRKKSLGI